MRAAQVAIAAPVLVATLLLCAAASIAQPVALGDSGQAFIAALRESGDGVGQRRHVWATVERLVTGDSPAFESWRGEGSLFARDEQAVAARGMLGFARPAKGARDTHAAGAPVITYTLYNDAAFDHIRRYALQTTAGLDQQRSAGQGQSVPSFPADAIIVKTAWWPVAGTGLTAMPVWDPEANPAAPRGNPYLSWRRVVAVDPSSRQRRSNVSAAFMGQRFPKTALIPLTAFHSVPVDASMAARLSSDSESRRAAAIALGRPIEAGDFLALVGVNLMTHEQDDWVWAALWWHDAANVGPFGADRPPGLQGPWANYLMQAAFDAVTPVADDGGPHVAFNPWLEGRFADGGAGGGTRSNCMACHRRASYPAAPFLPVTRGAPKDDDVALGQDRLRTSFLWSAPLHAQP